MATNQYPLVEDFEIKILNAEKQEDESWIYGTALVTYKGETKEIEVGCWKDTNNDNQCWCSDHEGERILEAFGLEDINFAAQELGSRVVDALRVRWSLRSRR